MDVSGVSSTAELIAKYGILTVLLAVFILAFVLMFKLLMKQVNTMFATFKQQNDAYFKQLTKPDSEPEILSTHVQVNEMIEHQLRKLRDESDADRAFVYMFHNSDHGIGGFPFLKASCFYEWRLSTIRPLLGKQRDIPVFLLATALKELSKGNPFVIQDITTSHDQCPALAAYMEEVNSCSAVLYPLKTDTGGIIGFLGIDFTSQPIEEQDIEDFTRSVSESALVVQSILDISKGGVDLNE